MSDSACGDLRPACGDGAGAPDGQIDGEGGGGDDVGTVSVRNSSFKDLSDDEISTKKELHWRLGPADLNDTLVYDFPDFQPLLEREADGQVAYDPA